MRVVRQGDQRFTGTVARHQIVEGADKTVARVGSHQQLTIVAFHQHMFHGRPRRQSQLTGKRLALATRGRQGNRIDGIAAPGGIDKHHRLVALAFRRGLPAVARFIAQALSVDVVPFGAPHPAHLRQNDSHWLRRLHIMLAHRFRFFTFVKRRAAFVTESIGISLQLFFQQVVHFTLRSQNRLQLVALFFQLVLLAADLHLFQFGEVAQF